MRTQAPAIDPKVYALMTGELGTNQTISKVCVELGHVLTAFLPDLVEMETQQKMSFYFERCETGYKNELITDMAPGTVLMDGSLKNWCSDFTIACSSSAIIALVETLMGGDPASLGAVEARPASSIELEMAPLILDKIAQVIKSAVDAPGNYEPILTKPHNLKSRPKPAEDYVDMFAALIRMKIEFGDLTSFFEIVIPQKTLLKTKVRHPVSGAPAKAVNDWADILEDQVRRSDVKVEARIHLTPLTLGVIAKLQPGDVIPFLDKDDVRAQVSANGRDLYSCEFGRAGNNYTVRVRESSGSDQDLLRDLLT
ncbi:flagellar motor switch protein FliM [Rhizobium sp. SG_E_25_P2]|jgi:flagellar motor switch protein FliM|uniref:FliM/FliN family flagellar motor switch protein n=1 Tax=Rhizobium sp. SG_E_25_P2 TaxID=2879942 RepID=UPI0024763128|nr:FliM/FliN family flagellar motor switch protein [Rhizobium sp. SG_E_25_P2]MDH6266437.1 flagellar motor switch protein FliM [Rhizobium sp. SG_E_25_P2]